MGEIGVEMWKVEFSNYGASDGIFVKRSPLVHGVLLSRYRVLVLLAEVLALVGWYDARRMERVLLAGFTKRVGN